MPICTHERRRFLISGNFKTVQTPGNECGENHCSSSGECTGVRSRVVVADAAWPFKGRALLLATARRAGQPMLQRARHTSGGQHASAKGRLRIAERSPTQPARRECRRGARGARGARRPPGAGAMRSAATPNCF